MNAFGEDAMGFSPETISLLLEPHERRHEQVISYIPYLGKDFFAIFLAPRVVLLFIFDR